MAKQPKKRNKKYNPLKAPRIRLEFVPDSITEVFKYIRPWRYLPDIITSAAGDVLVEDLAPIADFAEGIKERQEAWWTPEWLIYAKNPRAYKKTLLRTSHQYAQILMNTFTLPIQWRPEWQDKYDKRVEDAYDSLTIK